MPTVYQESADPFARTTSSFICSGGGKDNRKIWFDVAADKMLGSIDDPVIPVRLCACCHRHDVRAGTWLCDGEALNFVSFYARKQIAFFLLITAGQ